MAFAVATRSRADRLDRAFARSLDPSRWWRPVAAESLLGLEHEFRVLVDERPVDFSRLIHHVGIPGARVDPGDPNAYRGAWGGIVTADGPEGEIAIAPVAVGPGAIGRAVAGAHRGRSVLAGSLPAGARLEGFSTHLSVSVPDRLVERVARTYARTFAPALMLLLDGAQSPGLLVRPRRGRLELGGEFVDGDRLRAALTFAAGSVALATHAARRWPLPTVRLPPRVEVAVVPTTERFGWFVARNAFGVDLYEAGRVGSLRLARGGSISAQQLLAAAWRAARRAVEGTLDDGDLRAVDRLVAGAVPLGIEQPHEAAIAMEPIGGEPVAAAGARVPMETPAFGRAIAARERGGLRITPALLSWDFAVLRLERDAQVAYACLPRRLLGAGLEALDSGRLDLLLLGYLEAAARGEGRLLTSAGQTNSPGLYRGVGHVFDLLAPERGSGGGQGKHRGDQSGQSADPASGTPAAGATGSAAAAAGAAAVTAAAVAGARAAAPAVAIGAATAGRPIPVAAAVGGVALVAVIVAVVVFGGALGGGAPATSTAPAAIEATPAAASLVPSVIASPIAGVTLAPEPSPDPSCSRESQVRSTAGDQPATVHFVNGLAIPLQATWLDYSGKRVVYEVMPPGTAYDQSTFITHPWMLVDQTGQCLILAVTQQPTSTIQRGP